MYWKWAPQQHRPTRSLLTVKRELQLPLLLFEVLYHHESSSSVVIGLLQSTKLWTRTFKCVGGESICGLLVWSFRNPHPSKSNRRHAQHRQSNTDTHTTHLRKKKKRCHNIEIEDKFSTSCGVDGRSQHSWDQSELRLSLFERRYNAERFPTWE